MSSHKAGPVNYSCDLFRRNSGSFQESFGAKDPPQICLSLTNMETYVHESRQTAAVCSLHFWAFFFTSNLQRPQKGPRPARAGFTLVILHSAIHVKALMLAGLPKPPAQGWKLPPIGIEDFKKAGAQCESQVELPQRMAQRQGSVARSSSLCSPRTLAHSSL